MLYALHPTRKLRPHLIPKSSHLLNLPQEGTTLEHAGHYRRGRKRLYRENSPYDTEFNESYPLSIANHESRSASMESECCGGVLDCRNFVQTKGGDVRAHAAV